MIEKKIKYTDFLGNVREETFRFNLMESEVVELQSSVDGGLAEYGKRIVEAQSLPEIMTLFKKLLLLSYGEKSFVLPGCSLMSSPRPRHFLISI